MSKLKKSDVLDYLTKGAKIKFLYSVDVTNQFKRDVCLYQEREMPLDLLREAVCLLAATGTLSEKYRAHKLKGYKGTEKVMECHLQPD